MSHAVTVILALIGVPLFAVMALGSLIAHREAEIDLQVILIEFYRLAQTPLLASLPLFAFSGYLLARTKAPERLLRVSNALVGWLPGGLAVVVVAVCISLTALTGASGITIVALGGLLLPALLRSGYSEGFSLGLITAGGSTGLLLPPSLPVILYGVVAQASIEELFIAGLVPTLLIFGVLGGYAAWQSRRQGVPRIPFSGRELLAASREAMWELPLPIVVPLGILLGFLNVSDAAAISTAYLLIVELVVYREVGLRDLGAIARESMVLVGGILIILGMTFAGANYIINAEIPQRLLEYVQAHIQSRISFLLLLNLFLLVVGCLLDVYAATALVVPLIVPIAQAYGVDLTHLGIIFLANLAIGYVTPPVGMNLFVASLRFSQPILRLCRVSIPFILLLLAVLAAITFIPDLSLKPVEWWRAWQGR